MATAKVNTAQAVQEINTLIDKFNSLLKTTGQVGSTSAANFRKVETALKELQKVSNQTDAAFERMNKQLRNLTASQKNFVTQTRNLKNEVANLNDKIAQRIKSIFESVNNDVVINELKIDKNILELKANFLKDDTFSTSLKPNLVKLYKDVILNTSLSDKKINISGVVLSRDEIESKITYKKYGKEYITDEFMPLDRVSEQLKILLEIIN